MKLLLEFLDLVKAFDKMDLKGVMLDVWKCNVKGKIWRNIYEINKKANIHVKTPVGISDPVTIKQALKQGSVLASVMAALHTDAVNRTFNNEKYGVNYGEILLNNLLFQDDIIKLESDENRLNEANLLYQTFQHNNRMMFHKEKSKVLSNHKEKQTITLNGTTLENTKQYKYLGDIITEDGRYDMMIKTRGNEIMGLTAELMSITGEADSMKAIILYINAIILPKLLNNADVWSNLTRENYEKLQSIVDTALKRLIKIPTATPSIPLRGELGIISVEGHIAIKKLLYLQRVKKMDETTLCRRVLEQQERIPGKTWIKEIKSLIIELKITETMKEIENMSKGKWKSLVLNAVLKKEDEKLKTAISLSKKCAELDPAFAIKEYIEKLDFEEAKIILETRLRMNKVKANFKTMYENTLCDLCKMEEETLEHLFKCKKLNSNLEINLLPIPKTGTCLIFLKNSAIKIKNILHQKVLVSNSMDASEEETQDIF